MHALITTIFYLDLYHFFYKIKIGFARHYIIKPKLNWHNSYQNNPASHSDLLVLNEEIHLIKLKKIIKVVTLVDKSSSFAYRLVGAFRHKKIYITNLSTRK